MNDWKEEFNTKFRDGQRSLRFIYGNGDTWASKTDVLSFIQTEVIEKLIAETESIPEGMPLNEAYKKIKAKWLKETK